MADDNIEIELELTYLAKEIPAEVSGAAPVELMDIYVPEDAPRPYIRLRQKGKKYEITKKKPIDSSDFSRQTEQTIPLDEIEFNALSKSSSRKVVKDRYQVNIGGSPAEIDVFKDDLKGLVLIDFEFNNSEAKQSFQPPTCCLADVTQELFIAGGQLAGVKYSDIESDLNRFNYKKLSL